MFCTIVRMVDDLKLCLISEATEFFPHRLSEKSVMRRIQEGRRGVRLQAVCDGGRWFTCRRWVNEFLQAVTESSTVVVRSPAAADKAATAAMELLERRYGRGKKEARPGAVSMRR